MISATNLRPAVLRLVWSVLLGLPLTMIAFWVIERASGPAEVRLEGAFFQSVAGEGRQTASGLDIWGVGPAGQAIVARQLPDLPAERFRTLRVIASGLDAVQGSGIYWTRADSPDVGQSRPLTLEEARGAPLDLGSEARWQGNIRSIGLIVQGPLSQTVSLRTIDLTPAPATFIGTLTRSLANAAEFSDWSGGDVNFHVGAPRDERRITPVTVVTLWLIIASIVFLGWSKAAASSSADDRQSAAAIVLLAVAGWMLLDLRWQAELIHRALKPNDDPALLADARRAAALADFRSRLLLGDPRVFIVSDDPSGYAAYRTRYHLGAVKTSFGMPRPPTASERRPGDFILVLGSREPLQLLRREGLLVTPTERIPVDMAANSKDAGVLLRVRGGS